MSLELTGKIKSLLEVQGGTSKVGKEWKKQNFTIVNNDGYEGAEQTYCFEVFGEEAVENLSKFNKEGDNVKVSFNIKCNEWKGKYFTGLSSWRIEKVEEGSEPKQKEKVKDLPF